MLEKIRNLVTLLYSMVITLLAAGNRAVQTGNSDAFVIDCQKTMEMRGIKNAFMAVLIGSIMAVVVGAVMLYIGIFTSVTVYNAIPHAGLTAADNTTLSDVKTNVNTAFTLLGIVMIVGGAGGILAVLLNFVPRGR